MVGRVQEHLEAIYGLSCRARVNDYLVDERAAKALGWTGRTREELLVLEENGELEVALFLDRTLLERFAGLDDLPLTDALDRHLDAYCKIAEGVSHFLYLAHSAEHDRTVSLLELETQAEIDKFASCVLHGWNNGLRWANELVERLFDQVNYLPTLSPEERWRYEEANRVGRNYCSRLLAHVEQRSMDRFLSELRYSYRLGAQAKVRYLAQTA